MRVLETGSDQGRLVYEKTTREFDCVTGEGVEFLVRIEQDWNGMEVWSNLQEDGKVGNFNIVTGEENYEQLVDELLNSF
jgi:hypothetical protein